MRRVLFCFGILLLCLSSVSIVFADQPLPRVVFDQGHNQRFLIDDKGDLQLSGLAEIIRGRGADVSAVTTSLNDDLLRGVTALIITGPFDALKSDEVDAVTRFVEKGGCLAVMLHVGQPLSGLLAAFDVDFSNAVLHERNNIKDRDINFMVKNLESHPLFEGLPHFSLYGGWALKAGKFGAPVARTSDAAWVDLDGDKVLSKNDAVGSFDVVVAGSFGAGGFVVFGDDAIFQNRFLDESNRRLASNLADKLLGK